MNTETREIVITIKGGKGKAEPKDPEKEKKKKASDEEDDDKAQVLADSVFANRAYRYVKQKITEVTSYEVSKYYSLTDDYMSARELSHARSLLGIGMGLFTAGKAGAAMGGPVGAVLGVAAALGTDLISSFKLLDAQQIGIDKANAQLSYTMSRRGASLTDDSIGENR